MVQSTAARRCREHQSAAPPTTTSPGEYWRDCLFALQEIFGNSLHADDFCVMVSASRGRQRRGWCAGASAFLLAASCLVALAPQTEASEGANQDAVVDEREPDESLDEGVLFTDSVQFSSADLARGEEASDTVSAGESLVGVCSVVNCFCLICGYFCS